VSGDSARRHHARTPALTAAVAVLALAATACGAGGTGGTGGAGGTGGGKGKAPHLTVRGAYVPQPVTSDMAGGFLTVHNSGSAPDKLTSVTSGLSENVQIHRTVDQRMKQVMSLPVPANGELRLGRGGGHLMLMKLKRKPVKGDRVSLTLHFAESRPLKVSVPVEATNYVPGSPGK
jgi:copper(I)-binding protein